MKGALAVFLELFRHVQAKAGPVSLGMLVTSDEETGGSAGVRHVFQDLGLRCGTALIPDGGSLTNITVEEKGVVELRMTAHGHGTHAARPWLSDNALKRVLAAAEDVSAALNPAEDTEDHWHTTCTLTMVDTRNRTPNRIAGEAGATLDVRFPAPLTSGEILARVRNIVPGDVAVEIGLLAEPACLSPDPLFLEVANELTGNQVNLVREHGASDARFAVACGIPVVMSRPDVGNLHAEDEWIDIESMMAFFTMYATYLERKLA
jgi:succinyl-diaminopimelate desuccinylase